MEVFRRYSQILKSLPREAWIVLGILGVGSLSGVIFLVRRHLWNKTGLVIAAIALALLALVYVTMWLFGWSRRSRVARMDRELSSGAATGMQSMDVSAAIKSNNEKFAKAKRDLQKSIGISVYDLPWYIVIGDSGCGKTKLVNEAGLTFSTGKPEGYQLGTLNYNWWFSEDAIFIDMAGRLCNPQDDGDRREWLAFLDTVARGRKGYPINGALVCVSAEHLLEDPPEKHERDANTALERLRDLQTKLGVTFATYLVVTKCDKILGFMQFFDRATRDITVKNQIFGWSRPGTFQELYDPENFKTDFDAVHRRLNDLRLQRLNDDAEEIDLGLAYSFPEEFRRLGDPLQSYSRTLFPLIRTPRAVKNLIFRGIYFTSATQEGELILKHLSERLGSDAASQFPPLDDLYPHKRPHFIKDVLVRKVFPEYGLVFRNEQQVVRNRRLSRALMVATSVLGVLLFSGFVWSYSKFNDLIARPTIRATDVATSIANLPAKDALEQAGQFADDHSRLADNRLKARVLCGFLGRCETKPIGDLDRLRAELVERALQRTLADVRERLRSGSALGQGPGDPAKAYLDALVEYVRWAACCDSDALHGTSPADSFDRMLKLAGTDDALHKSGEHKDWYFKAAASTDSSLARNPAVLVREADDSPADTIVTGVEHAFRHFRDRYATLRADHPNETVAEWMRILKACERVETTYRAVLDTCKAVDQVSTLEDLSKRQQNFLNSYMGFEESLKDVVWKRGNPGSLADALWDQRAMWRQYRAMLADASRACGASLSAESSLAGFSEENLDRALWKSLGDAQLASRDLEYSAGRFGDKASFVAAVRNVHEIYKHVLTWIPAGEGAQSGTLKLSEDAETVQKSLEGVGTEWRGANFQVPNCLPDGAPEAWINTLFQHLTQAPPARALERQVHGEWKPIELKSLLTECGALVHRGVGACLLHTVLQRLDAAKSEKTWGFASLIGDDERSKTERSSYAIPRLVGGPAAAQPPRTVSEPPPSKGLELPQPKRPEAKSPLPVSEPTRRSEAGATIPLPATPKFLWDRAGEVVQLGFVLDRFGPHCLRDAGSAAMSPLREKCKSALEESMRAYMGAYVQAWDQAYAQKKLTKLSKLAEGVESWEQLAKRLKDENTLVDDVGVEFTESLRDIVRSVSMGNYTDDGAVWAWDNAEINPSAWFSDVLQERKSWESGGWEKWSLSPPSTIGRTPWGEITASFKETWDNLIRGMKGNDNLVDRRDRDPDQFESIPWGKLEERRSRYGLGRERLTARLLKFERWAQALLDARLTELLVGIQGKELGGTEPDPQSGWPFLRGDRFGPAALATVKYEEFKRFLEEVAKTQTAFAKLESEMGRGQPPAGYRDRRVFYAACERWKEFLKKEKVEVDVCPCRIDDGPVGRWPGNIKDYCREVAGYVELQMGAQKQIRLECESQKWEKQTVAWELKELAGDWSVTIQEPKAGIRLVDKTKQQKLGEDSPLGLFAYLQRYGDPKDERRTWYVVHSFDVEIGAAGPLAYGQVLQFDFGKTPLPEPIRKLEKVSTPKPPEWDDLTARDR